MKVLIVGGAGFLGNNLVRRFLVSKANAVRVVDSLEPRLKSDISLLKPVLNDIEFVKGDMRDLKLMKKLVAKAELIVNCAAQTSHPLSLEDPLFDVELNCRGNLNLLEAIKEVNPKAKVIYVSSSTVIGRAEMKVVDERHGEMARDIYSANKGVAEKYYFIYNQVYGIPTLVLRFANLYGPFGKGSPDFGFINYFIHLAHAGKEIPLYGAGKQSRNVMYAEDASDLIYECSRKPAVFGDIYFAVHREHYTVEKIAQSIVNVFNRGKVKQVPWSNVRKRIEIGDVEFSGAKLYYKLKWEPKYNLRAGLKKTKEIMDLVGRVD